MSGVHAALAAIDAVLRGLFDLILFPFSAMPPLVGLIIVSLVASIGILLVYKKTSDQKKVKAVKDRVQAGLFEIRLFNDDMVALLQALGDILRNNAKYVGLSLVPVFWMFIPFIFIIAQLEFHYGYSALKPGQSFSVKAAFKEGGSESPDITLDLPAGLVAETPAVWSPALKEVVWRVRAERAGSYGIKLDTGGQSYTKTAEVATGGVRRRAPERLEPGIWNQLIYPAEPPLPSTAPLKSISVSYPAAEVPLFLGFSMNWMIVFFVLSIAFAFALKGKMGVAM